MFTVWKDQMLVCCEILRSSILYRVRSHYGSCMSSNHEDSFSYPWPKQKDLKGYLICNLDTFSFHYHLTRVFLNKKICFWNFKSILLGPWALLNSDENSRKTGFYLKKDADLAFVGELNLYTLQKKHGGINHITF